MPKMPSYLSLNVTFFIFQLFTYLMLVRTIDLLLESYRRRKFDMYIIRKRPIDVVDPVLRQIRLKRLMHALMFEPQSLMSKIARDLALADMLLSYN